MNNKKNKYIILGFILLIIFSIWINVLSSKRSISEGDPKKGEGKKLQVVTSFYPLYYFATQIAGDKAVIKNITPPGAEPHDYDPSTQDVANIEKSDMLILNGSVESWGGKIRDSLKGTNVAIVNSGEELLNLQISEDGQNQIDPHIWLDPVLAKKQAHAITLGFEKADPANAAYYKAGELTLHNKLDELDALFRKGLSNCNQSDIITSHASFGYVAKRYNLHQVAISGLSPDAEPSMKQLADVARFAKTNSIKYIFFESLVSPKLSQTIATEIGAKTLVLDPIEGVSDADKKSGKDYYTIMKENLKNLQIALECKR